MFFQIAVTPPNQATKKPDNVAPLEDVAVLKLAPFTPNPKIFFENVAVGEVDVKKLIIQNSNTKNKLTITRLPPADRFVTLSWSEIEVEAQGEVVLELSWAPKEDGSWRDVITIRDGKNVDRNVALIFKSLPKKGKKRVVKSKPTVIAIPAVKKFRSPKNTKKRSPLKITEPKNICMPITYKCETCENNIHITTCSPLKKKNKNLEANKENSPSILFQQKLENLSPIYQQKVDNLSFSKLSFSEKINRMNNSSFFSSPTNINFKCENILPTPIRRETYVKNSPEELDDSLEIEKKIDNICFSPDIKNSAESFIKKLNLDMSPDVSVLNNTKTKTDNYLVHKLLSDSFQFSTSTVTKKSSNIKFTFNDTSIDEVFYPNSTEITKINRNNSSTPKELFKGNNTYEISPNTKTSPNLSGDTYSIRSNLSSTSTYNILSPEDNRIKTVIDKDSSKIKTSSPLPNLSSNSNYFNFSGINVKNALSRISEEDTPSDISKNISLSSNFSNPGTKRKPDPPEMVFTVSPPKRAFIKPKSPKAKNINTTWSKKFDKTEKIRRKSISTLKLNLSKVSSKSNSSNVSTCSSVNITQTSCSIDPFLIAAMYDSSEVNPNLDPFISSTLYYDETWLEKQMQELKKWLNALLTPPSELATKAESKKVDVAKLWQDCVKKDLIYAPTKEKVSSKYHTNTKLEILRKNAKQLFHSSEMKTVLSKVTFSIENKHLAMREDKNLHLDVGLQSHILTLLLCYNHLWLRIGLETIYNEPIPLDSNSDVIGLSTFIMLRFFRCPELIPKNKQQVSHIKYLPGYATAIKKFTLKKFLMLVYFLDQAKNKKLISHDPCLFCRDAPVKESKELLLSFSREILSAIGDVTKFLRRFGYEVSHKQSYIEEFDYAVKHLGIDLRDGIRLTKVMEIILLRNDLTSQLRGPAISRLQKIHNVKLALDSLNSAGYTIAGDITAKDIVDGNREKTLSLLWQIIYKFQAPRFSTAAIKIQIWWKSLAIVIKRRILDRPRQLKINSAIKIQRFYRSYKLMKTQRQQFLNIKKSAIIIQRFVRSSFLLKHDRLQYLIKRQAVVIIQQRYRAQKLMKIERNNYLQLKQHTIFIQNQYRAKLIMKQTRAQYLQLKETTIKIQRIFRSKQIMKLDRQNFNQQKNAAITIQNHFRANLLMKQQLQQYLNTRNTIIKFQQRFRATMIMKHTRNSYLKQRESAIVIQQQYRATMIMKQTREIFLQQKQAAITIQQRFRANRIMKLERQTYLEQRNSAIVIQQQFRAHLAMKTTRQNYLELKQATIYVQRQFRANKSMKIARQNYLEQKQAAIAIQQRFRANIVMKQVRKEYLEQRKSAIVIQQQFRAQLAMKTDRQHYLKLKQATLCIQQQFRANKSMNIARQNYLNQQKSAVVIQQQFRAYLAMKTARQNYLKLKQATICIQQRFRANKFMKIARQKYLDQQKSAIVIQQQFRAYLEMKTCREQYIKLQQATIFVQQQFRANLAMKSARKNYLQQVQAIKIIQQKIRAYLEMKKLRQEYLNLRNATIFVQQQFRANVEMKLHRQQYLELKKSVILIQQKFRATSAMKIARHEFIQQRNATIYIQRKLRAHLEMKKCRENYLELKEAVINVQNRFRANQLMKQVRNDYLEQRNSVITIQKYYRSYSHMKHCREEYLRLKEAALVIQEKFRANRAMKLARQEYLALKQATICIQERFRANVEMKKVRENYLNKRNSAITIQKHFRSYVQMKQIRANYLRLKQATQVIQQRFRANRSMKIARETFVHQKNAAMFIQTKYRAYINMKKCRTEYLELKKATLVVQTRFRANQLMKNERNNYLHQRTAAIFIQRNYRQYIAAKKCRESYLKLKQAVLTTQQRFRANRLMKIDRENYLKLRNATLVIQQKYRAYLQMKTCRKEFKQQKQSVIIIQNTFRAYKEMKKCKEQYTKLKRSACIIQDTFRAYLCMKEQRIKYMEMKQSTITIQKYFRSYVEMKKCRQEFLTKKDAAIKIQRFYRAYRKQQIILKQQITIKSVIRIQCWVRRFLAQKRFENLRENSKTTEEKRQLKRLNNAATKIQSVWRGYKTRKEMDKKLVLIHQRSVEANTNAAPEYAVGSRNREAIDLLMYQTSMKEIIRALTILDFTTRLFPNLCIEVCDEITERLYILLCFTNRSVPDMDASILCVSVLINLYKFQPTSCAVWKTQYLERLLSLLLQWSDKDGLLFPYVCTLIWLFAQNKKYCQVLKSQDNIDKILKKSLLQCERRQKMLGKMRNAPVVIAKGQKDILPLLKPDWGIININKPRVFKNPVFAIKCLLKKLNF